MATDRKYSFIIPYTDRDAEKAKRAEHSIKGQDYKNVEVIKVHDKNKKGASWARNTGARKAKGDVLFFFDADCILSPGILMHLNAEWDDHPEADFLYGQYRFMGQELQVYPSRAWNPYVLESMNYINTMSPMKRKVWKETEFRQGLDYFQDWDFFLRAVKSGYKGRLVKGILFQTEKPDKDSISGHKDPYWKRVRHVQALNKIPRKPICVTTFGAPYQAEYRAEVLGADYLGSNLETDLAWLPGLWGDHDYEMIYVMGFYPRAVDAHMKMFEGASQKCLKAIHWIGTDVYQLSTQNSFHAMKALREDILSTMDVQWATSDGLVSELSQMGIETEKLICPVDAERFKPVPAPKSFAVGCYVSDTNPMHNEKFLQEVAAALPHVKFFFFGRSRKDKDKNIEYIGNLTDVRDVIRDTSLNLRMTVHDGLPQTVIQYLLSGRDSITNADVKYARNVNLWPHEDDYGACKSRVVSEIVRAMKEPRSKEERQEARDYWAHETDPQRYKRKVYKAYETLKAKKSKTRVRAAHVQSHGLARGNGKDHAGAVC